MQNLISNPTPGVVFSCPCGTKNRISDVPTAREATPSANEESTDIVALHTDDIVEDEKLSAKNQQLIESNINLLGNIEKLNQSISDLQEENSSLKRALEEARTAPGRKNMRNQNTDSLKSIVEYLNELTRTVYRINKSLGALGGISQAVTQLKDELGSFRSVLKESPSGKSNVVFTAPATEEKNETPPPEPDTIEPDREKSSITTRIRKKKGSLRAKSERLKKLGFS